MTDDKECPRCERPVEQLVAIEGEGWMCVDCVKVRGRPVAGWRYDSFKFDKDGERVEVDSSQHGVILDAILDASHGITRYLCELGLRLSIIDRIMFAFRPPSGDFFVRLSPHSGFNISREDRVQLRGITCGACEGAIDDVKIGGDTALRECRSCGLRVTGDPVDPDRLDMTDEPAFRFTGDAPVPFGQGRRASELEKAVASVITTACMGRLIHSSGHFAGLIIVLGENESEDNPHFCLLFSPQSVSPAAGERQENDD